MGRGIYTSDNIYSSENLPKDMDFRKHKGKSWSEMNDFKYIPAELAMCQAGIPAVNQPTAKKNDSKNNSTIMKKMRHDLEEYQNKENMIEEDAEEYFRSTQKPDQF